MEKNWICRQRCPSSKIPFLFALAHLSSCILNGEERGRELFHRLKSKLVFLSKYRDYGDNTRKSFRAAERLCQYYFALGQKVFVSTHSTVVEGRSKYIACPIEQQQMSVVECTPWLCYTWHRRMPPTLRVFKPLSLNYTFFPS